METSSLLNLPLHSNRKEPFFRLSDMLLVQGLLSHWYSSICLFFEYLKLQIIIMAEVSDLIIIFPDASYELRILCVCEGAFICYDVFTL